MNNQLFTLAIVATIILSCSSANEKNENTHSEQSVHEHDHDKHDHGDHKHDKEGPNEKKPLSPHTSTMATIGEAHVHIDYSSPRVRGRIIFGGLLGYDQVWQAGAHRATWIETNKALLIDDRELPAGKYGFFVIPGKEEWTLIFNKNWDQHGKDEYNESEDVLRLMVKPEMPDAPQEELTYEIEKIGEDEGSISLSWEKVKVQFSFRVNS